MQEQEQKHKQKKEQEQKKNKEQNKCPRAQEKELEIVNIPPATAMANTAKKNNFCFTTTFKTGEKSHYCTENQSLEKQNCEEFKITDSQSTFSNDNLSLEKKGL